LACGSLQRTIFINPQAVGAVHHALGSSTHHSHVTVQSMSLAAPVDRLPEPA
jgi:hypothetical protein